MTTIDYLQKELKKALNDIAYYKRRIERLNNQLQQKENIIKEAREYIEENKDKDIICWSGGDSDFETCLFKEDIDELLEILDKAGNSNERN